MREDFKAMLAGVPLLSAEEREEFFAAVVGMRNTQITEGLAALTAGVNEVPVDKRVAKYVKLRDARAATNKEAEGVDKAFKQALEAIEGSLLAAAQAQGVSGFKTEAGTAYIEETMHASIGDENAFYQFVRETGDLDFFERRIKIAHIKEYQEANEGRIPPGLNTFRQFAVRVRRS